MVARKKATGKARSSRSTPLNNEAPVASHKDQEPDPLTEYDSKLKKRALAESPLDQEPDSKKIKESPPSSVTEDPNNKKTKELAPSPTIPQRSPEQSEQPAPKITKETWQGFCEIESDPAYFSVILRDLGVRDVTVREVFAMHPDMLDQLPQPIFGLILLFRHREVDMANQGDAFPSDVWFTNQLPAQNSCATLAMINILMNNDSIHIGEHLSQFKDFTRDFTPFQRGEAFASFDFVKKIHNSFAKEMDILEDDKHLAYKATKAWREKKAKKSKSRSRSTASPNDDDSNDDSEENAHHFIAFVPVGTEVWKLDGMDAHPMSMGTFDPTRGETWLSAVTDKIIAIMAAGDDDYGIIAMTQSPLVSLRSQACVALNTLTYLESRLATVDKEWSSFVPSDNDSPGPPHPTMLGIEGPLPAQPIPEATQTRIASEQLHDLLDRRTSLLKQLSLLSANIMAEMQSDADEDAKATERRFDYGPVIKTWLEILAENGYLEDNLERFMPASVGGGGKKAK